MNTLTRRLQITESLFPSPMEAVLVKHLPSLPHGHAQGWTPERLRADWRKTRGRIGYTPHEEAAFAELIDRTVTAIFDLGKEAALEADRYGMRDPTPEEAEEARRSLLEQPLSSLSDYLKARTREELWASIWHRAVVHFPLQFRLIEAGRDCTFWQVGSVEVKGIERL